MELVLLVLVMGTFPLFLELVLLLEVDALMSQEMLVLLEVLVEPLLWVVEMRLTVLLVMFMYN